MSNFYKKLVSKFKDENPSNINNEIVYLGRTEEEKEQLQEMCDEIDSYHRRLKDLRESGMTPGKWLEKEIDEFVFRYNTRQLNDCQRFDILLSNMTNRLRYRELVGSLI